MIDVVTNSTQAMIATLLKSCLSLREPCKDRLILQQQFSSYIVLDANLKITIVGRIVLISIGCIGMGNNILSNYILYMHAWL